MSGDENPSITTRESWAFALTTIDRADFLAKVKSRRYKTAELIDGSGFVSISDSAVSDFGSGPVAVFSGYFCDGQFQIWTESDLKNFCF